MKAKTIIISATVAFIAVIAYGLKPVPIPDDESECLIVKGVVTGINEGGVNDAVFSLQRDKRLFYINRGLENGLDLDSLRHDLLGKEATILYPDYWALLNSGGFISTSICKTPYPTGTPLKEGNKLH